MTGTKLMTTDPSTALLDVRLRHGSRERRYRIEPAAAGGFVAKVDEGGVTLRAMRPASSQEAEALAARFRLEICTLLGTGWIVEESDPE